MKPWNIKPGMQTTMGIMGKPAGSINRYRILTVESVRKQASRRVWEVTFTNGEVAYYHGADNFIKFK